MADQVEAATSQGGTVGSRPDDGRPYVVVSSDTHASPDDLDHFLSYVDPASREAVAAFGDLSSVAIPKFGGRDPGVIDDPDPVRAVATRRLAGMGVDVDAAASWLARYDSDWVIAGDGGGRRLAVLEEQGIHAEVTLPGPVLAGGLSPAMYLGGHASKGLEPSWPAVQAYNRWLGDFCAAAPGRRAGVIVLDLHDIDRAVDEIAWARQAGLFGGVMLPAMSVTSGLPGYADDYYDRLWSACEDHQMVVVLHTGASGAATDSKYLYDKEHGGYLGLYEVFVFTRRPLWFMILGGVFDRHPELRVAIVENGVQWLPSLVRDMEQFFDTHGGAPIRSFLKQRPADYVARHLWLGGSLMKRYEAEMRHEIGVDRLMWGADYPHIEGAAPVHRQVLGHVFGGLPEPELRRMLGANAVDLWGFDGEMLQGVADRVGPTVADLATQLTLGQIPETFSWSLARPVPLAAPGSTDSGLEAGASTSTRQVATTHMTG
jgi:predicted TIM-barrel fold metal-dependent hydrolase